MVLYSLKMKATFQNVKSLYTTDQYDWFLKMKCSTCGEDSGRGWHAVNAGAEYEPKGKHHSVNFKRKCKLCSQEGTLSIVKDSVKSVTAEAPEQGSSESNVSVVGFSELVQFDCRGLEPVEFMPTEGWIVVTMFGTTFENVDFPEKEWVGYDARGKQPAGVFNFESRFDRV